MSFFSTTYDIVIVGGGISGLFLVYKFIWDLQLPRENILKYFFILYKMNRII